MMTTKKSLGGNLLNHNQLQNQHRTLNCRNSKVRKLNKAEASSSQDDNKSDDEEEQKDDKKISFYLKLGKYKKFKYM